MHQGLTPSDSDSDDENKNELNPIPQKNLQGPRPGDTNTNRQNRNYLAAMAFLFATAAGPWATSPQSSETPSEVNEVNMDPCFGAAFTEWSEWSDCDPIYNCDSEMNPNNPKKCPKKTRSRQIAWLPNHTPNPECNEPLTEHDESQCNCDKCIFRYGDWVRAPECHGGGHKCHLKFTRFCQLQNKDFLLIDQYKGGSTNVSKLFFH